MGRVKYIIRLDDACPTMCRENWDKIENLCDQYDIKPVVAVIPNNEDKKQLCDSFDYHFWHKVRNWQKKGWDIALHGYNHVYTTKKSGLVPLNHKSEFAGLPLDEQKIKIQNGIKIFKRENIISNVWVAPSHTFDKNTLKALRSESNIQVISDGISFNPFLKFGFKWVPQQLWEFKKKDSGIWTGCFHPNTMTDKDFYLLESFFKKHYNDFVSISSIKSFSSKKLNDYLFAMKFYCKRWIVQNILD